jgi:hypothetical protein
LQGWLSVTTLVRDGWETKMSEAAPQAARTGVDEDVLGALVYNWGEAYRIGWDPARGYWAHRRDDIGGDITADDPDQLWQAIHQDYELKPVPRDLPGQKPCP